MPNENLNPDPVRYVKCGSCGKSYLETEKCCTDLDCLAPNPIYSISNKSMPSAHGAGPLQIAVNPRPNNSASEKASNDSTKTSRAADSTKPSNNDAGQNVNRDFPGLSSLKSPTATNLNAQSNLQSNKSGTEEKKIHSRYRPIH